MSKAATRLPNRLPKSVARKIAERFCIPKVDYEPFCDSLCNSVQRLWERAAAPEPSSSLRELARKMRALQKAFDRLQVADRERVEHIRLQSVLWGEGLHALDTTIMNLGIVFNHSVGRSSPIPRVALAVNEKLGVKPLNVKNQIFKEVVIALMTAAVENRGKFTLDPTCKTGSLIDALDDLREQGLVPDDLSGQTIQRIKKQFWELRS